MYDKRPTRQKRIAKPAVRVMPTLGRYTPVALAVVAILRGVHAQDAPATASAGGLEEIVVTASKRSEEQQTVPISIQALSTKTLENLNVQNFTEYAQTLTGVTFQQQEPGTASVSMRGISSGAVGNFSGELPTVGQYLDEQPITTIQGAIDVHVYDIARVEVLPGPQGTLYGASSESGTIRVITNKPDATKFAAGYDLQVNTIKNGTIGSIAEGFVNIPISDNLAARLVGWYEHDSGYIDNVFGTVNSNGHTFDNAKFAKKHFNPVDVVGGRGSLKFDLSENWTITPVLMAQQTKSKGIFGQQLWKAPDIGPPIPELSARQFEDNKRNDKWVDAALTVQGKIANFDVTYAGAYLQRHTVARSDYSDYEFFYQQYTSYWPADYGFYVHSDTKFQQFNNELRIASPREYPIRFVGGLYQSRQLQTLYSPQIFPDNIRPQYEVGYPNPPNGVTGIDYLLNEQRVNRDSAAFGELSWDITSKLTALAGIRRFKYDNSLEGFYGFGPNAFGTTIPPPLVPGGPPGPGGISGQQTCFTTTVWHGTAPCEDINVSTTGTGWTPKFNLSYKFDDRRLVYVTYSKGFRPGGVNRTLQLPPYAADFLKNYEVGFKTTWLDNRLRLNGAVYKEKWNNFQFDFTGAFGIPLIANAGTAEVKGGDIQTEWAATNALSLRASFTYTDAKMTQNYCGALDDNGQPVTSNPCISGTDPPFAPLAPEGTRLPGTPKIKASAGFRYLFPVMSDWEGHFAGDFVYQSEVSPELRVKDRDILGVMPSYTLVNFFLGAQKNGFSAELLVKNAFDKRASLERHAGCNTLNCGPGNVYNVIAPPRLIGLQIGQRF